ILTYRNLMLTMLLGGLWHGASWNFAIWGAYHGALLSLERLARNRKPVDEHPTLLYPLQAAITFVLVLVGWVFFRAKDLLQSLTILRQIFAGGPGRVLLQPWHLGLAAGALIFALAEERWEASERLIRSPGLAYAGALTLMFACVEIFGVVDVSIPFVYFQF